MLQTGRQLLESIFNAFLEISFALMSDDEKAITVAVDQLKKVREDVKKRLEEQPEWRDIENYFSKHSTHPAHFNKEGWTLLQYMDMFATINPQSDVRKEEFKTLSALIANRVFNMSLWIREDASKASEPFFALLR